MTEPQNPGEQSPGEGQAPPGYGQPPPFGGQPPGYGQQPGYGPPPGYGQPPPMNKQEARAHAKAAKAYSKAQRNFFLRHKFLTALGAVIVLIVIIAVSSSGGGSSKNVPAASDQSSPAAPDAAASSSSGGASASAATAPVSTGQVLLSTKGNGDKQTQKFTAGDDWDLAYTYDCSNFAAQGNFVVEIDGSDGNISLANEGVDLLGAKGSDVTHEHHGGTYYLAVSSECTWTIKVTSA